MPANQKKVRAAPAAFVPTRQHHLSLGQATQLGPTITAYGKLIAGFKLSPFEARTSHPQGKDEKLQLALVYGIQNGRQCNALPQPQKVYLPSPDGPAEGCDLDPKEFVIWKNLPCNWITLHVQSRAKPIAMVLQSAAVTAPTLPYLEDVLNSDWLKTTRRVDINPGDQLGYLWAQYGVGDYTPQVVQNLINAINNAYGVGLPPSSLPATLPFSQLQDLVGHS
jgi:hypothetical protein